ncbi:hypothetical protein BDZ94DRAFT_1309050 [Collybia nuda]|uniref:Uncharacterized protein n=1 Tax=Collybia nuda TaxID=64659 RepID=A0A9P5Y8J6_9AGAR|nr:hypothetical protein BDZ94DRAFT_1309050 [Collybia nuda]
MLFELASQPSADVGMSTDAVCDRNFSWMYNSHGESPCLVAAKVIGACHAGNWKVGSLRPGEYYTPPSNVTANMCSCSYSAYNLLSACTTCQYAVPSEVITGVILWANYIQHCSERQRSKIYFPESIPWNVSIPYWATKDPGLMDGHHFNASNALFFASQGIPDLVPGTPDWQIPDTGPTKASWTATAVVGGILGGFGGIMFLIDVALYLLYRRSRRYSLQHGSYIAQEKLKAITDIYLTGQHSSRLSNKPQISLVLPESALINMSSREDEKLGISTLQKQ